MQMLKLFPVVALLGVAYAKEHRGACLAREARASLDSAPNADIGICYHGHNSAYTNDGNTDKSDKVFGGLRWADCHGIGLDCFWMKAENIFQFWDDGGSDNLAFVARNDNCISGRPKSLIVTVLSWSYQSNASIS